MPSIRGVRGSAVACVCALVIATLPAFGCATVGEGGKTAAKASKVKVAVLKTEGGKERLLTATSREDGGLFFTRPPYLLGATWRVEVQCGLYDAKAVGRVGGTIFGLEVDRLDSTKDPVEFYGVFARHFESPSVGMQVFASSEDGNHGQIFLNDATVVDLAIARPDAGSIEYYARDAIAGGDWQLVATRNFQGGVATHYPGFGLFQAPKGATVAFTNFRVPENTPPDRDPSVDVQAVQAVYEAALQVLEAGYALAGPETGEVPVIAAQAYFSAALERLDAARTAIQAVADSAPGKAAPKTPVERAFAAVDSARKDIEKSQDLIGRKGTKKAAAVVNTITKKLFRAAFEVTDALLPQKVRDTLPGDGLDW